ncbi:PLD nuclease N-terminal domain-containing protein [Actinokineospora soli]|uniref:PLD nuclease N-terminal domain-containing protein n=1 Tax=Actinokineospora soli TaxID=1048753 RepID=A0ABW2TRG8_9PSEU
MSRKWSDLTRGQRRVVVAAGIVQTALAAWAWTDLARRPADRVNGPKAVWAAVIAVNFAGPIAYRRWGRRPTSTGTTTP